MVMRPSNWLAALMMSLLLFLTFWLYQLGFSGVFHFDDPNNLAGLSSVHDAASAWTFIFSGGAGALGRPLTLASFLLQKDDWPLNPAAFFFFNTLVHLVNGMLVYWLTYRLAQLFPKQITRPAWFSLAVTALWLTQPLLASASLMAVQRMTTLSATFALSGLVAYVAGRTCIATSPARSYVLMTSAVVLGTTLSVLCKENGALLPLYVLVLEVTLIRAANIPSEKAFRLWQWVFLGMPAVALGAYFAYTWPQILDGYAIRSFTLSERLLTETRILWEYMGQILMPSRAGTGPFHDDYMISRSLLDPAITLIATLAWALSVAGAWFLRRRYPVFLFALLWFLAGHLLESSVIPLELYFEHRNYLPSFGPLLAVCIVIWSIPGRVLRIALAGLIAMIMMRIFVLGETTHLWGQPLLAGKMWADEHPLSSRAAQFLTQEHFKHGDTDGARKITVEAHERIKTDAGLALQSISLSCTHENGAQLLSRVKSIEPVLLSGNGAGTTPFTLNSMLTGHLNGVCNNLSMAMLHRLTDLLLLNPKNQKFDSISARLHVFKARLYANEEKLDLSARQLETAFSVKKDLMIAKLAGDTLASAGRYGAALEFLTQALQYAPSNPVLKQQWETEIGNLRLNISERQKTPVPPRINTLDNSGSGVWKLP